MKNKALSKKGLFVQLKSVDEGKRRLVAVILERALGERNIVTCRQLLNSNIPAYIKEIFLNHAKKRFREEKPIHWNFTDNYDFDDDEVRNLLEQLTKALILSVKFHITDLEKRVVSSVNFYLQLYLKPFETIEKAVFMSGKAISTERICRQLENLNGFSELSKHIAIAISNLKEKEINKTTFNIIAKKAVKKVYNDNDDNSMKEDFKKFVEFYFYGCDQFIPKAIDSSIFKEFLLGRGMVNAVSIVEKKEQQGKKLWRTEDVSDLYFYQTIPEKYGGIPEETKVINIKRKTEKKKPKKTKIIFSSQDDKYTINRRNIEKQPPGPYPALGNIISTKEKKTFIKRIFNNDLYAYLKFMEILDSTEKWKTAKNIIDTELERRDIDTYSKEALKLGDRVFSKYFSSTR